MAISVPVSLGTPPTNSIVLTLDTASPAGIPIVVICWVANTRTWSPPQDTAGNTYVIHEIAGAGTNRTMMIASCANPAALSIGHQIIGIINSSTIASQTIMAFKVAGLINPSFDDSVGVGPTSGSHWTVGPTATLQQVDEIAIYAVAQDAEGSVNTPDSGWTDLHDYQTTQTTAARVAAGYQIVAATTALTAGGTTNNGQYVAVIATFKGSSVVDAAVAMTATGTLTATGAYVDGAASLTAVATLTATAEPVGTFGPGGAGGAMGQDKTVTIRMQTLDGVWETVGSDRLRGVWPENDTYKANDWGPSTCSFDLKRDPGRIFPDLSAWTPCEVEIGGVQVWDGRVRETPTREGERVVNVQGFGWQYHLDDHQYRRVYVHSRPSDYKDARSFTDADLTVLRATGRVDAGNGAVSLIWPLGEQVQNGQYLGAILDFGEGSSAKRAVMTADWIGAAAGSAYAFYARAGDTITALTSVANDAISAFAHPGTSTTAPVGTFPVAGRYVIVFIYYSGATGTAGYDVGVRLRDLRMFADTAYESGNVSILKATDIIPDALDRATFLLSDDRSGIDPDNTVTFAFPGFALQGQKTPREVIDAANAVHRYVTQVAVGRRMIFKPRPSVPLIEIGAWPGSEFDDSSANSADDIYNHVNVEGTGADGSQLTVDRSTSQLAGVLSEPVTSPAPDNPSFTTDTADWTASSPSTITRVTGAGLFDSSPAAGQWKRSGVGNPTEIGDTLETTFAGTFQVGATYTLHVAFGYQAPKQGGGGVGVAFGVPGDRAAATWPDAAGGNFTEMTVAWTPSATQTSGVTLLLTAQARTFWLIDSLALTVAKPTLVDRRGFVRTHTLPVECSLTPALGQQIADVFLAAHKTTPLRGTVKIEGNQGCRSIQAGHGFAPERLLLMTSELLRLSHRIDPDTGGQGRDGRIAEVEYVRATDTAIVALDSSRTSHEALLKRLAVVVGS